MTLARNVPGVQYVSVRGTWRPRLMDDVRILNKYGLLDDDMVKVCSDLQIDATRKEVNQARLFQSLLDDPKLNLLFSEEIK